MITNVMNKIIISGVIVILLFNSCFLVKETIPTPNPDTLLSDDKIKKTEVYTEPKHLKQRLYGPDATMQDLSAEKLVLLRSRQANKIISELLKSNNEEVVKSILKALSKHKDERFLDEVIYVLETAKTSIHSHILIIFSNIEPDKVAKRLLKQLNQPEKPESVRQNLVKGLSMVPSKRSIIFLISLLTNRKSEFNSEIINTLYSITRQNFNTKEEWIKWWETNRYQTREKWLEQSITDYTKQIEEKDNLIKRYSETIVSLKIDLLKIRLDLARKLADATLEINLLTTALDDEFIGVKRYALEQIRTLEKEKTIQILPKLIESLGTVKISGSPLIENFRLLCVSILGDSGDIRVIEPLLAVVNNPREPLRVRHQAIIALGKTKSISVIPHLVNLIDAAQLETIPIIVEVLGSFGKDGQSAVSKIHEITKLVRYQNDEKTIKSIIDALGDIKDQTSIKEILAFISDLRTGVRWAVANALGKIGDPETTGELAKLLNDEFLDIRQITIISLGKLGNKSVSSDIAKILLNDKDIRTRQLCAEALGKIKDISSLPSILTVLGEADEKMTTAAWNAVLSITSDNLELMEETTTKLIDVKHFSYASLLLNTLLKSQKEDSPQWWKIQKTQISLYLLQKEYSKVIEEVSKLLSKNSIPEEIKAELTKIRTEAETLLNQSTQPSNSGVK
jgi:HEAT repeat protein